jgi:hypothetical protein
MSLAWELDSLIVTETGASFCSLHAVRGQD